MNESEFTEQATQDPALRALLQSVADEVRPNLETEAPPHYSVGGLDIVLFLAGSALYRWANNTLDHRRQAHQTEILQQQAAIVASLVASGIPPKDAQTVVTSLLKNLDVRPADDPALTKALSLLTK